MGITHKIVGKEVYLDANIFIYLLEGYKELTPFLTQLFGLIDQGVLKGVTSELTLAETLVKPMCNKNLALQKIYEGILQSSSDLEVRPINKEILIAAAQLRADMDSTASIRLPDAIHLATAQAANCKTFFTNDKRLKVNIGIKMVLVSEVKTATLLV